MQGGAGEVLGFGLAGALAKGYNKITGFQIRQIDGARQATAGLARDREFMRVLKAAKDGNGVKITTYMQRFSGYKLYL